MRDVVRRFGSRTVLHGIDLTVAAGEIHALLGPNGAGKTTLTRILAGLTEPHAGEVRLSGTVGFVPSGDRTLYNRISGLENLIFFGRLSGLRLKPARARASEMLEQVGLGETGNRPVGKYSHGMQKRLSVARALLVEPAVLLVDEATHDLDPEGARRIRELVRGLAGRGVAVLWTTQRIEEIRGFADNVTFLLDGKVRFAGTVGELIESAPEPRYVVRVRNGNPDRPPEAATLQRVIAGRGAISRSPAGPDHFVLAPAGGHPLGSAVAALDIAGYSVLACQRDGADIEEAFLALSEETAQ